MASTLAVITGTTAVAGSGKSYKRGAVFAAEEWLPNHHGRIITNLPLKPKELAEYVSKRTGKSVEVLEAQIEFIPEEVLKSWRMGTSHPGIYFASRDIRGCRIILDEMHKYCSAKSPKLLKKEYQEFCGELRHRGASFEMITQALRKLATELWDEAGTRYTISNSENRRDFFFGIIMGDWYEMRAAWFTGEYVATCWQIEKREVDGKWHQEDCERFTLDPKYFPMYDSYNRPDGVTAVKSDAEFVAEKEFQKRGKLGVTGWFIKRNFFRLISRGFVIAFLLFLCLGGGAPIMKGFLGFFQMVGKTNGLKNPTATGGGSKSDVIPAGAAGVAVGVPMQAMYGPNGVTYVNPGTSRPSFLPQAVSSETAATLAEENKKLQADLLQLQKKFETLGELVLLSPQTVTFRDGITYVVGQKIEIGPFAGHVITSINYWGSRITLDDGRSIRISRLQ